jgi:hypothetical protein
MSKFNEWFSKQGGGWDTVDPEDAWNAALDAAIKILDTPYSGMTTEERLEGMKS